MNKFFIILFLSFIMTMSLISSELNIGESPEDIKGIVIELPEIPINFSTKNVNSSNFWDDLDSPNLTQMENNNGILNILQGWLTSVIEAFSINQTEGDSRYWNIDGDNATGNYNISGNITANYFKGDGSELNFKDYTTGSIIFSNGIDFVEDNDNYFWDNVNKRLGIGTNAPANDITLSRTSSKAVFKALFNSNQWFSFNADDETNFMGSFTIYGANEATRANQVEFRAAADGAGYFTFKTRDGGAVDRTRMMITNDGLMGINEDSPDAMLEIVTNVNTEEGLKVKGSASQSGSLLNLVDSSDNIYITSGDGLTGSEFRGNDQNVDIDFVWEGNTLDDLFFIDAGNDRVGIGTSTPTHKLNVGGDVNVTGDLIVGGSITSKNVFLSQYIFAHNNATISLVSANIWANVTIDQEDTDIKLGIAHVYDDDTSHIFTIIKSGVYSFEYDFDVIDTSVSASDIDVAGRVIYVNGTELLGSVFETDVTKQNIENELSHSFLARLNAGDKVVFQFVADDADIEISTHGTFGDHPESASVEIIKVANL